VNIAIALRNVLELFFSEKYLQEAINVQLNVFNIKFSGNRIKIRRIIYLFQSQNADTIHECRYSSGAKSIRLTAMRADRVATLKCNRKTWGDANGWSTRRVEAAVGRIGVHCTGAIRPREILRIGFTKFHYGATCCRLTRSPPSPAAAGSEFSR